MTIAVSYEANPREFADAYREITRRGFGRILRWGFGLGIPIVETILILSDPAKRSSPTLLWQLLPWWVMFPGLFIGLSAALRYWAIKRLLSDDASQRGLQHRRLDNEGLHIESTGITARVSWSALRSAVETPSFFLLFQSRDCAYYLPKSAMTAESVAAARLLLKEQMHVRARLRA
jgi:hypothetical protein